MSLWLVFLIAFGCPVVVVAIYTALVYYFGTDPFTGDKYYKSGR